MRYVSDTHALVRYIVGKLPRKVDEIFRKAEEGEHTIFIPTIALAECRWLVEHKKIALDFHDLLERIETSNNFMPLPFDIEILRLMPEGLELHDQIIVATAKLLNAKLLSKDRKIRESGIVECVWG